MSVIIKVTYLDGAVRQFAINDPVDPEPFYTWYYGPNDRGIDCLTFKRRAAPSAERVQIPLSQVRHWEVINHEERRATPTCISCGDAAHRDGMCLFHANRYDFERELRDVDRRVYSTGASTDTTVDISPGVTFTAYPDIDPETCEHDWREATLSGSPNGIGLLGFLARMGPFEGCTRCGLVREQGEHQGSEPDRQVPGEVADGPQLLGDLWRTGVRKPAGWSDGEPARPGGVAGVAEEGVAAVELPQGPLDPTLPQLYPVILQLHCPEHGLVAEGTLASLRVQQDWESYIAKSHYRGRGCKQKLNVIVPNQVR